MATATYTPIATTTLGSAAASITFSSIPSTYTDLRLVLTCTTTANANICVQVNNDTATNYSRTYLTAQGSGASSGGNNSLAYVPINTANTSSTIPGLFSIDFFSYAGSTNKTFLANAFYDLNGSGEVCATVGLWRNTAAITSVTVEVSTYSTTFGAGTIATLWGI